MIQLLNLLNNLNLFLEMDHFVAGGALENTTEWSKCLDYLENKNIPIYNFIKNAVNNKEVSYFDGHYYTESRKVQFNNKKYQNHAALVEEYKHKSEHDLNYKGTRTLNQEFVKKNG